MRKMSLGGLSMHVLFMVAGIAFGAEGWTVPEVRLSPPGRHPVIACTADELARLRDAYRGEGPGHDVVIKVVHEADESLAKPVTFPPRGGQHNQWYQCDKCELALKTVSDTQHQCPKCGKIYSGEPYDDVVFKRYHGQNLARMRQAAWAYAITGDRRYADDAAKVLLGYADRYLEYPYHSNSRGKDGWNKTTGGHLDEQTLGEANILAQQIAPAYDLIHDSAALSDADRRSIEQRLILPMLQNIDKYKAGKSNWQTWHNAAMLWGGAVIGDESWVRKAIDQPGNGFAFQMTDCVSAEGMWYENSWGYHFYTLQAMIGLCEGSRRLGVDLWHHPALKRMFLLPMQYVMADGSLPRFGDDMDVLLKGGRSSFEFAYRAYTDPVFLRYVPKGPTLESVLLGRTAASTADELETPTDSQVFPSAGHAVLRSRGAAGLTAALTFSPYGGFHGHFDKLGFVFFGRRQELGVDPGRAASQAYRLPVHTQWYKATISHNTLVVDQESQKPAAGKLECFATDHKEYAAALASCDTAYPGVKHKRLLLLTPACLLVCDHLISSDKERRFDWLYHNRGTQARCDAAVDAIDMSTQPAGYKYVQNARAGSTDGDIRVGFADGPLTVHLTMAGQPGSRVLTGDGPGASVLDRVPLVMVTRQGKEARFAAVIEPVERTARPSVESLSWHTAQGGEAVEFRVSGTLVKVVLAEDGSLRVTVDGREVLSGRP
jgi:oligo-alginate lyase